MKKLTKSGIAEMAQEIKAFLEAYELDLDVCLYYNGIREHSEYDLEHDNTKWITENNKDPHKYFKYAATNHILSMSFEGALYDSINYSGDHVEEFMSIFKKYGLYYELGHAWNLTAYVIDDDMVVEYTVYKQPERVVNIGYEWCPDELQEIKNKWFNLSKETGDSGLCVLGAGFKFKYKAFTYFLPAQSPWQGSLSWEAHIDTIRGLLNDVGATEITYDWGNMD